jgi:signal transduction histidine kinase
MRRLYLQIYGTVIIVLLIFTALSSILWWLEIRDAQLPRALEGVSRVAAITLPAEAPASELQQRLERLAGALAADATLYAVSGEVLASFGAAVPVPNRDWGDSRWLRGGRHREHAFALALEDGRWLVARLPDHRPGPGIRMLIPIAILALATVLGCYPMVRRLTRRLEALQATVEDLGQGHLTARAAVEGRDEVARLAEGFNRTAERIEGLIDDKKKALATVSHELRTPLARIRMALELLGGDGRPEIRERIERDIRELDGLIGELLIASRLDSPELELEREATDLLAMLAEEAARFDVEASGDPVTVSGDPRLLRRLIKNLLENARRHAGGASAASVTGVGEGDCLLTISDSGPGVPAEEREHIFEPFYRLAGQVDRSSSTQGEGGLGLALVRQIAERHGGSVRCTEREGGGTRFEVRLPQGAASSKA